MSYIILRFLALTPRPGHDKTSGESQETEKKMKITRRSLRKGEQISKIEIQFKYCAFNLLCN